MLLGSVLVLGVLFSPSVCWSSFPPSNGGANCCTVPQWKGLVYSWQNPGTVAFEFFYDSINNRERIDLYANISNQIEHYEIFYFYNVTNPTYYVYNARTQVCSSASLRGQIFPMACYNNNLTFVSTVTIGSQKCVFLRSTIVPQSQVAIVLTGSQVCQQVVTQNTADPAHSLLNLWYNIKTYLNSTDFNLPSTCHSSNAPAAFDIGVTPEQLIEGVFGFSMDEVFTPWRMSYKRKNQVKKVGSINVI